MPTEWISIWVRAFGHSIKGKVADGNNVIAIRGSDATGTKSRAVVGEIACVCLRSQWKLLMVAE